MRIGPASAAEQDSLADLLWELHQHEHDPPTATLAEVADHLRSRLLDPASPVQLVVAVGSSDRVVGLAAVVWLDSVADPSAHGRRQCQLKELYVRRVERSGGIGAALVRWVAAEALERGCGRIDWHVKATNDAGIAFYERLSGRLVDARRSMRLDATAMAALVTG